MKDLEKLVNILFKIIIYIVTAFLAFMFMFDREYINVMPTNELIIVCTLLIMGYTMPD